MTGIQVATRNPTGKNRLQFSNAEEDEAAAGIVAAAGGAVFGDGMGAAEGGVTDVGAGGEAAAAAAAEEEKASAGPASPLELATEMWAAQIAMAIGNVSPEMIADFESKFAAKFAPTFALKVNPSAEVVGPGCDAGFSTAMAIMLPIYEGLVNTKAENTAIEQVSPDTVMITQEFSGHFPDASGAPIPGTEATVSSQHTCTYDMEGLVTMWIHEYDADELNARRAVAAGVGAGAGAEEAEAVVGGDDAAAGEAVVEDLNATQWSRKSTTRRAKSPTAMPLDDLEAVAWFYEDACVSVCDMTDPEISELRMLRPAEVPVPVLEVLEATMILFMSPIDWRTARKVMSRSFRKALVNFDKDQIFPETINALVRYDWISSPDFDPEHAFAQISPAAGVICKWVRGAYTYARALQAAGPKMLVLQDAARKLARGRVQRQTVNLAATQSTAKVVYLNGGSDLITIDTDVGKNKVGRKRILPGIAIGAAVNHIPRGKSAESLARGGGVAKPKKKKGGRGPTPPKGGKPGGNRMLRTRPMRTQKQPVPPI